MDCKWLTVSEVMKLLKSFGGDEIEMKVVSLLDPVSSMVSTSALVASNGWGRLLDGPWRCQAPCLPLYLGQRHLKPSCGLFCSASWEALALGQRDNLKIEFFNLRLISPLVFLVKFCVITG